MSTQFTVRAIGTTGFGLNEEVCALTQDGVEIAIGPRERLQLWAVAPELLVALDAVLSMAEAYVMQVAYCDASSSAAIEKARAAIAKARGES